MKPALLYILGASIALTGCTQFGSSSLPSTGTYKLVFVPTAINSQGAESARALERADETIRDGRDAGQLSRREARGLRREARQIGAMADRFAQDGLSPEESRELQTRAQVLKQQADNRRFIKEPKKKKSRKRDKPD
ncbi:hypothetical protein [Parerythrobacter jejuensis]|uniref:Lipoprotein n=1 Tax=Parerythrobacter jejuensis TaxID=795812 RepID=A0A845AR57_9SPHN|nr:hypothetical protein [Parerythrobacter jejuensis]MXP32790.1 hypothetical protein [Parerythrobacter jejuensis]